MSALLLVHEELLGHGFVTIFLDNPPSISGYKRIKMTVIFHKFCQLDKIIGLESKESMILIGWVFDGKRYLFRVLKQTFKSVIITRLDLIYPF